MKFFHRSYDGGVDSGVTGYWLIESKRFFSIVLLHFSPGSREAFHSHAFNAVTWWVKGTVEEAYFSELDFRRTRTWCPSLKSKYTPRNVFHKVIGGPKGAWAISIRGPWADTWQENKNGESYTLTHGRKRLDEYSY